MLGHEKHEQRSSICMYMYRLIKTCYHNSACLRWQILAGLLGRSKICLSLESTDLIIKLSFVITLVGHRRYRSSRWRRALHVWSCRKLFVVFSSLRRDCKFFQTRRISFRARSFSSSFAQWHLVGNVLRCAARIQVYLRIARLVYHNRNLTT
jgi:hypothetical protein